MKKIIIALVFAGLIFVTVLYAMSSKTEPPATNMSASEIVEKMRLERLEFDVNDISIVKNIENLPITGTYNDNDYHMAVYAMIDMTTNPEVMVRLFLLPYVQMDKRQNSLLKHVFSEKHYAGRHTKTLVVCMFGCHGNRKSQP